MASDMGDIKHIVRYFRSSCSSAAGSITETTVSSRTLRHFPVRISFVPLDPNIPLEEQHGGNFDLILHKLTEDILSLAMSSAAAAAASSSTDTSNHPTTTNAAAHTRVQSLLDYKRRHEFCCLIDDPNHVRILMSRSDISKTLQRCLQNVTSASGHPVRAPKHIVVDDDGVATTTTTTSSSSTSSTTSTTTTTSRNIIRQQLDAEGLRAPLIVKPLIAAGTKQSHYMTIVLNESAVDRIPPKSLVQQYVNHDAVLYKVYVLGEYVHVYRRPSLPNLPLLRSGSSSSSSNSSNDKHATTRTTKTKTDLIEFDSQRPYPRLEDFGYYEEVADEDVVHVVEDADTTTSKDTTATTAAAAETTTSSNNNTTTTTTQIMDVTPEEVRPIVEALKRAFGLELFGFDILINQEQHQQQHNDTNGTTKPQQQEWLVVDVNYFPSYKEVPNFPALLAQYLTNRVLNQRRRTLVRREESATTNAPTTMDTTTSTTHTTSTAVATTCTPRTTTSRCCNREGVTTLPSSSSSSLLSSS